MSMIKPCSRLSLIGINIAEVADLIEKCEVVERQSFGAFDILKVQHPELGERILVTSHGEDHVVIGTVT